MSEHGTGDWGRVGSDALIAELEKRSLERN
jgi:hypothetical protein